MMMPAPLSVASWTQSMSCCSLFDWRKTMGWSPPPGGIPLDLGERRLAVDFRLPTTEPVEVRAVEDVQRRGVSVGHGR
jgi:hypothetical protein